MNLKEMLKDKLTDEELERCPRSYEAIGDIAIIEIPETLELREKIIAKTLLDSKNNIRLVVKKKSERKGEYRLKDYEILAGEGDMITEHKENYCKFKLDISKVYFSSKESTERLRMSNVIQDGEDILVIGCGIGPFPIIIAKNRNVKITGIDSNKWAIYYFKENIELNKLNDKIIAKEGDAKTLDGKKYDRILITIPQSSYEFLETASNLMKEKGHMYVYTISPENEELTKAGEIKEKIKRECEIVGIKHILPYSPGINKICIDMKFY